MRQILTGVFTGVGGAATDAAVVVAGLATSALVTLAGVATGSTGAALTARDGGGRGFPAGAMTGEVELLSLVLTGGAL